MAIAEGELFEVGRDSKSFDATGEKGKKHK